MSSGRLQDLLVRRATQALTEDEREELESLLEKGTNVDETAFEFAAAALHLSALRIDEPLPASLRTAVERDAAVYFSAQPSDNGDA